MKMPVPVPMPSMLPMAMSVPGLRPIRHHMRPQRSRDPRRRRRHLQTFRNRRVDQRPATTNTTVT